MEYGLKVGLCFQVADDILDVSGTTEHLGKTAGIAVMGGWDTDCNGATAGSVLGAMLGAKKLPKKLVKPLNDTVESIVLWNTLSKISDMAKRTLKQAKRVAKG